MNISERNLLEELYKSGGKSKHEISSRGILENTQRLLAEKMVKLSSGYIELTQRGVKVSEDLLRICS